MKNNGQSISSASSFPPNTGYDSKSTTWRTPRIDIKKTFLNTPINWLYSLQCPSCGVNLVPLGRESSPIKCACEECQPVLNGDHTITCTKCSGGFFSEHGRCLTCAMRPSVYQEMVTLGDYLGNLKALVRCAKFGNNRRVAIELAKFAADVFYSNYNLHPSVDLVVPVPSMRCTLAERGFSLPAFFAAEIANRFKRTLNFLALSYSYKESPRTNVKRSELSISERVLHTPFLRASKSVRGKRILIVDDVLTSGKTINAAADAVMQAGARDLWACVIARSVHYDSNMLLSLCSDLFGASLSEDGRQASSQQYYTVSENFI